MLVDRTSLAMPASPFDYSLHSTINYMLTLSQIQQMKIECFDTMSAESLQVEIKKILTNREVQNGRKILESIYQLYRDGNIQYLNDFKEISRVSATAYRDILLEQRIKNERANDDYKKFLCKLSYFINEYTDAFTNINDDKINEKPIIVESLKNPWDVIMSNEKMYLIDSKKENNFMCYSKSKLIFSGTVCLPTWIDKLSDYDIVGGSSYSHQIFHFNQNNCNLCIFETNDIFSGIIRHNDFYYGFTFNGKVILANNINFNDGEEIFVFERYFIDKIFRIEGIIYLISFTSDGFIIKYNIDTNQAEKIELQEMISCNDVVVIDSKIYAIDKMQGYIFKYNLHGELQQKYLAFGDKKKQLIDPISLEYYNEKLIVVNWINNKIAEYEGA